MSEIQCPDIIGVDLTDATTPKWNAYVMESKKLLDMLKKQEEGDPSISEEMIDNQHVEVSQAEIEFLQSNEGMVD